MNRRDFLRQAMLGSVAMTQLSCPNTTDPPRARADLIVDAHCHVFNASDLPLEGFVKNSILRELQYPLEPLIAALDFQLQATAPGFYQENARLDDMLAGKAAPLKRRPTRSYNEFLEWLAVDRPAAYAQVTARRETKQASDTILPQVFEWARLLTSYRVENVQTLVDQYPDVELFTPAQIDFGPWLQDDPLTRQSDQILLAEKIVRLFRGRVHPLVGFDPLRQTLYSGSRERSPFAWARRAVTEMGFVGVKLYPPMGFQASGNTMLDPPSIHDDAIEAALDELYAWCGEADVPILVHGTRSFPSQREFGERANPAHWRDVLERFPGLRLNIGHLGGDVEFVTDGEESWTWTAAELMQDFDHVYGDAAFHEIGLRSTAFNNRDEFAVAYLNRMGELFDAFPSAPDRLLYGSDWHVLLTAAGASTYLTTFENRFGDQFPEHMDGIMGPNALGWLGLDGAPSGNRTRLAAFYAKHGIDLPSWWQ